MVKRLLEDGSQLLSVVDDVDPDHDNDEILSLACYYSPCVFPGLARYSGQTGHTQLYLKTDFSGE